MAVDIKEQSLNVISLKQRVKYLKLLFKWKGGVWDLLWIDFIWFLGAHILVTILYQFVLMRYPSHRSNFESFLNYIEKLRNLVPLSFLLGFFVSAVLARWWNVVMVIPWISRGSLCSQAFITGKMSACTEPIHASEAEIETELYKIRASILRYLNMAWIFTFIDINLTIRERFFIRKSSKSKMKKVTNQLLNPKGNERITVRERANSINADGIIKKYYKSFILEEEIQFFEKQERLLPKGKTLVLDYWIPLQWSLIVLRKAYKMEHISHPIFYASMVDVVNEFQRKLATLYIYKDWKMPLVYIQVVIFVVYSFLFTEIFTQQVIKDTDKNVRQFHFQTYFPILSILKYFLYMGWFQIGLSLMYPFDGNKSDMPLNDVLDFNLMVGAQGCKSTPDMFPVFLRDEFGTQKEQMNRLTEVIGDFDVAPKAEFDSEEDTECEQNGIADLVRNTKRNRIV